MPRTPGRPRSSERDGYGIVATRNVVGAKKGRLGRKDLEGLRQSLKVLRREKMGSIRDSVNGLGELFRVVVCAIGNRPSYPGITERGAIKEKKTVRSGGWPAARRGGLEVELVGERNWAGVTRGTERGGTSKSRGRRTRPEISNRGSSAMSNS